MCNWGKQNDCRCGFAVITLISSVFDPNPQMCLELLRPVIKRFVIPEKCKDGVCIYIVEMVIGISKIGMGPGSVVDLITCKPQIANNQFMIRVYGVKITFQPSVVLHSIRKSATYDRNPVAGCSFNCGGF